MLLYNGCARLPLKPKTGLGTLSCNSYGRATESPRREEKEVEVTCWHFSRSANMSPSEGKLSCLLCVRHYTEAGHVEGGLTLRCRHECSYSG